MSRVRTIRRKIISRAAVFVLLISGGAIVNVAVAWGCVTIDVWNSVPESSAWGSSLFIQERRDWTTEMRAAPGALQVKSHWRQFGQVEFERLMALRKDPSQDELLKPTPAASAILPFGLRAAAQSRKEWRLFDCRGWPCLAVWCELRLIPETNTPGKWHGGISLLETPQSNSKVLPYLPLWPNFAVNTIFYAAILWLVIALRFGRRGDRRHSLP